MGISKLLNSSLFKASGIYSLSSIANASIPFLLIPILTRELSQVDYGIVAMAAIVINIITPFMGMSAHGAIQRKYFEIDEKHFSKYVGNVFFILMGSIALFALLFFVFNGIFKSIKHTKASCDI